MSTKTEKTIKEWLNELPEPYRSQAMKYEGSHWDKELPSLKDALGSSFTWADKKEGLEYWLNLYYTL